MLITNMRKDTTRQKGGVDCVMFDSRVDHTKTMEYDEETQQNHPRIKSEDHFSLTDQNGKYLTHLTHEKVAGPTSSSEQVADSIVNWMTAHGVDRTLVALGADSTASNTGHKGGVIHFIVQKIGRKCAWLVCELHTNELPLRHLMEKLGEKS